MWILALASLGFSLSLQASIQLTTQIHDIDYGQENEDSFILLKSGDVAWMKKTQLKNKQGLAEFAQANNLTVQLTLNDQHELQEFTISPNTPNQKTVQTFVNGSEDEYTPTVIESMDVAKSYFTESKYVSKESQCFNRAHIWSYEWFVKHNINSHKTWIFFTRKYIRRFKFEWWFHVSPSVPVQLGDTVKEKIMDIKYSRGPIDLKQWTDIFMRDDANCPRVEKYSDHANYPESGSCYTMRTSMFYYQPFDVETRETWGTVKANWYDTEIKQAYLEAFDEEI